MLVSNFHQSCPTTPSALLASSTPAVKALAGKRDVEAAAALDMRTTVVLVQHVLTAASEVRWTSGYLFVTADQHGQAGGRTEPG